jgi:predicted chitinase
LPVLTDLFTKTIPDIFIDVLSGFLNVIKNSSIGKFAGGVIDKATNFLQGKKSKPEVNKTAESVGESVGNSAKVVGSGIVSPVGIASTAAETITPFDKTSVEKIPKGSTNIQQNKELLLKSLGEAGITDPDAIANIFAQVQAESGFVPKTESLNYSAKRLFELYGKGNKRGNTVKFETIEEAQSVVEKGPEAIAETIYGNRMGNLKPGEGFKYRGRGFIQLSGKENYEKYGKLAGHPEIVDNPDLVNDPEIALKVAIAYLEDRSKGKDLTNIQNFKSIIGYAGGEEDTKRRAAYAEQFKKELAGMRIPSAELGGILSGPESGYLAQLHGTEAVVPLKDSNVYHKSNDNFARSLSQNSAPTIINNVTNSSSSGGGNNPGKSHRGVINTRSSSSSYQRVIFGDFVVV